MEKFRQLSDSSDGMIVDNYRHLQPLYNRRVFVRTVHGSSAKFIKYNNIHFTKWDWLGPDAGFDEESEENEIEDDQ